MSRRQSVSALQEVLLIHLLSRTQEPTFKAAVLEISRPKGKDGLMSANHHIITTLRSFSGHGPWGPQIFDGSGHLVFYSDPNHLGLAIQDPHICTFGGESSPTHLCASKVLQQLDGHMDTEPVIYDSGYEQVNPSFERIGSLGSADGHDFNVLDRGKTYLSTVYGKKMARLADVPGGGGLPDNWVYDACFQEVEVESAKSIVEWCYLDHFSIDEVSDRERLSFKSTSTHITLCKDFTQPRSGRVPKKARERTVSVRLCSYQ